MRYLAGFVEVELHNILIENQIRPLALGSLSAQSKSHPEEVSGQKIIRFGKNYLFTGNDHVALWTATLYSFFDICKIHDANPYECLVDTMNRLGKTSIQDLGKLMPHHFEK